MRRGNRIARSVGLVVAATAAALTIVAAAPQSAEAAKCNCKRSCVVAQCKVRASESGHTVAQCIAYWAQRCGW